MIKAWYVLQVITGKEIEVREKIRKEFDERPKALVPQEIETLIPRRKIEERKQGQVRKIVRTLFPSYVFLNIELDAQVYHRIRQIPHVIRFLGSGRPTPVPLQQMQPILKLCQLDELIDISKIAVGNTVEILDGPLKGFAGDIVCIDKRKKRARVRFQILEQVKEIDLGIEVIAIE